MRVTAGTHADVPTARRLVTVVAAVVVAITTSTVIAGPVSAATVSSPTGPCGGPTGVTLVVDASRLGGGIRVGCAPGDPTTGIDALRRAGFAVRGTARFPGFVCRIDDAPAGDPCLDTAPADAYWSYWHAARGGTWTYSDTGASQRRPTPGGVEGWVFSDGSGRPPGTPPPAATPPARPPAQPPTQPPVLPPAVSSGGSPGAASAPAPPGPAAVAGASTVPPPGVPPDDVAGSAADDPTAAGAATPVSGAPAPRPTDGSPTERADIVGSDAARAATDPSDSQRDDPSSGSALSNTSGTTSASTDTGSPLATLAGLAVVAAVTAVAVVTYRRRRAALQSSSTGPSGTGPV